VTDDPSFEESRLDGPEIRARLALPDRGMTRPDDHEGERFERAHRANDHRHHPQEP